VVLRIEADHLNVHKDFDDYVNAKGHIAEYQTPNDTIIYFKNNPYSVQIAEKSPAKHRFSYPYTLTPELSELLNSLKVPGDHNKENASCALLAVAAYLKISLAELVKTHYSAIQSALENFQGLPHHLEFVRTLNHVDYYDDSFSASYPSLEVAIKAFPNHKVILIAGGKDRNLDLKPIKKAIFEAPNLAKAILIGETRSDLAKDENPDLYILKDDFKDAVNTAQKLAETIAAKSPTVVLLSPGAASFDMFKNFYDRGEKFQQYVKELK
jgi:UDP-N-acetylmuramoylalanine--D-glutamate ligase